MSSHQVVASSRRPMEPFLLQGALGGIAADAIERSGVICRRFGSQFSFLFIGINGVIASPVNPRTSEKPACSDNSTTEGLCPTFDTGSDKLVSSFDFESWNQRADGIRHGFNPSQCFENLNNVLMKLLPVQIASTQASSGALTLLPTAGALIGAPSKELWVVYKLMPVAGVNCYNYKTKELKVNFVFRCSQCCSLLVATLFPPMLVATR